MKGLNDEGEKMGEGNWNESDLWQREAEENGLQTEPELQNAIQSPKQIRKTCLREVRRVCNVLGWALAFFSVRACHSLKPSDESMHSTSAPASTRAGTRVS